MLPDPDEMTHEFVAKMFGEDRAHCLTPWITGKKCLTSPAAEPGESKGIVVLIT